MTLLEMAPEYEKSAELLRVRMKELRAELKTAPPDEVSRIKRRIAELDPLRREMRELSQLLRRYYDRDYHKNEKYSL